ncbi:LOW QUALITY PROTEIN: avidin-like [Lacerta agilis]|uniref:LOW QUALITY PROTEIN: avidin-like n=1 Tax=Lacerta agilis TaxID=80427 RepID=UPI0014199902|nr:LOW QUALITY PROTEIN: avidin-like [Lacerta agilis]
MWSKVARAPALALLLAAGATAGYTFSRSDPPVLPVVEAAEKRFKPASPTLAGTWVNELGSKMFINPPNDSGQFTGSYLTAVSAAQKPIRESPLVGAQHDPKGAEESTFGFVVNWSFSDSIAAFAGQRFVDAEGKETLETTWLLRQKVGSHGEDWEATGVGRNVFTRDPRDSLA